MTCPPFPRGFHLPTLAEFGALAWFAEQVKYELSVIEETVENLTHHMRYDMVDRIDFQPGHDDA
jgi:hypothetical protein